MRAIDWNGRKQCYWMQACVSEVVKEWDLTRLSRELILVPRERRGRLPRSWERGMRKDD